MKELNTLLSQIAGQPNLEMQLRQLGQRFQFTQINAEQGVKLLKNFMNLKGLQSKTAQLPASIDQEQNNEKLEPIKPINAPSYFIPDMQLSPHSNQFNSLLSLLPYELRKKFMDQSKGLFGQNLNDKTLKSFDPILSLPRTNIDT
ncbi:unnamed protein product [Onchocerca ochengi]|uniref:Uncharacterized protein n=1 Tax=Onchocerca ochengi TaxID=42157 RepID=A0A182EUB3_ONCOC|nr:unnamed protein product [Onchocerca ochengi]